VELVAEKAARRREDGVRRVGEHGAHAARLLRQRHLHRLRLHPLRLRPRPAAPPPATARPAPPAVRRLALRLPLPPPHRPPPRGRHRRRKWGARSRCRRLIPHQRLHRWPAQLRLLRRRCTVSSLSARFPPSPLRLCRSRFGALLYCSSWRFQSVLVSRYRSVRVTPTLRKFESTS
jgi:hypothetical protein